MLDFSQSLAAKTDIIVERWIEQVRQGREIKSALDLPPTALRDEIPRVLGAMGTVLSSSPEDDDLTTIVQASLEHGSCRAQQGYNSAEITWEYCLLRRTIFSTLESDLLKGSPQEILRAFNVINGVLDQAMAQCFHSYVEERVKGLEQLQGQLSFTNQELARLLRASQDNISHLAHELKTPLNSIIGYSELLLHQQQHKTQSAEAALEKDSNTEGPADIDSSISSIERVLRNGRQLLRLVNDSLELSRYGAGRIELRLISVDARSVINNAVEMIMPLVQAKGLQLAVDYQDAPSQIRTDPFRLQQILTNLLSNAVCYTDSGLIQVNCAKLPDDKWSISVIDSGIGIAAEDQTRIFEPFARVVNQKVQQPGNGTGLGLAIISRLVHLLQGKIELISEVGVGSTFTVVLPLAVSAAAIAAHPNPRSNEVSPGPKCQ